MFSCVHIQAQSEVKAVRVELERAHEAHQETKQRLGLLEKEAKSSDLMSMELEDYQRSIQALEGELTLRGKQLEQVQKESQLHHQSLQNTRKDTGKYVRPFWRPQIIFKLGFVHAPLHTCRFNSREPVQSSIDVIATLPPPVHSLTAFLRECMFCQVPNL